MLIEWIELGKALAQGIGIAIPVIGAIAFLHKVRGERQDERFDRIDEAHGALKGQVEKLDTDFDGLTRQLGGIVNDVERRFLPREEGTAAINRLDSNIVELNRTIGRFSDKLFELARVRGVP